MSRNRGKSPCTYCTYCLAFHREKHGSHWGSSDRVVEIAGCSKCEERHSEEVNELKAELESLQLKRDREKKSHESDLDEIEEKSRLDLLDQKSKYEQLNATLKTVHETYLAGLKQEVKLKAELKSLQVDFDDAESRYETDLARLEEKSRLDLLNQKAEYEQLNAKLKASHETDLAGFGEEVRSYLLNQKAEYEQLSAKLTTELKNLKADNNAHISKIEFLKIRRDCNQNDVIIAVSDSRILAHRTILAERSPVFQKLLKSECSETQTKEKPLVKLDCLSSPVLEAIVDFCYSGDIAFSEVVPPCEVLIFAHTFQLGFLSELTEAELCRGLNVDNVPQMLKLARDYSALRLQEEAGKLFKEHFDILSSKVYEVLQGPQSSTPPVQLTPKSSTELDEHCLGDLNRLVDVDEQTFLKPDSDNTFY